MVTESERPNHKDITMSFLTVPNLCTSNLTQKVMALHPVILCLSQIFLPDKMKYLYLLWMW